MGDVVLICSCAKIKPAAELGSVAAGPGRRSTTAPQGSGPGFCLVVDCWFPDLQLSPFQTVQFQQGLNRDAMGVLLGNQLSSPGSHLSR